MKISAKLYGAKYFLDKLVKLDNVNDPTRHEFMKEFMSELNRGTGARISSKKWSGNFLPIEITITWEDK